VSTTHTVPDLSARCSRNHDAWLGPSGWLRLLRLLAATPRAARLDLDTLSDHRLRDLGLADVGWLRSHDPTLG